MRRFSGRPGQAVSQAAARWSAWQARRVAAGSDRGDVPGWVMVTVMTAALVVAIATLATPALQSLFTSAIEQVTGIGGD
ncbi:MULTISPECIES: hypothetical protein [Parafrankia]|uniref:Uncharacterized protein n=1 Tax=Parafrankia colletiae TaxID=573497 RepID=A0A1S1RGR9_9ACTN|nr:MULTISPECIES: hypothetical protein [Parafrankia]MCK9904816.1 hypothetical protein [Frankia sp. Cpl3]OHV45197.1 hypothetical protein CC117_32050 [Parafrankia colletiae]